MYTLKHYDISQELIDHFAVRYPGMGNFLKLKDFNLVAETTKKCIFLKRSSKGKNVTRKNYYNRKEKDMTQ